MKEDYGYQICNHAYILLLPKLCLSITIMIACKSLPVCLLGITANRILKAVMETEGYRPIFVSTVLLPTETSISHLEITACNDK